VIDTDDDWLSLYPLNGQNKLHNTLFFCPYFYSPRGILPNCDVSGKYLFCKTPTRAIFHSRGSYSVLTRPATRRLNTVVRYYYLFINNNDIIRGQRVHCTHPPPTTSPPRWLSNVHTGDETGQCANIFQHWFLMLISRVLDIGKKKVIIIKSILMTSRKCRQLLIPMDCRLIASIFPRTNSPPR